MCKSLVHSSQVPLPLSAKGREARWFCVGQKYAAPKQIADTWFSSHFGPIISAETCCRTITWSNSSPTLVVQTCTVRNQAFRPLVGCRARVGPPGSSESFFGCALLPHPNPLKTFEICPSRERSTLLATCYVSTTTELFLQYVSRRRFFSASLHGHFHEPCGQCGRFPRTECYVWNQVG